LQKTISGDKSRDAKEVSWGEILKEYGMMHGTHEANRRCNLDRQIELEAPLDLRVSDETMRAANTNDEDERRNRKLATMCAVFIPRRRRQAGVDFKSE
jgi:hypothetical protein